METPDKDSVEGQRAAFLVSCQDCFSPSNAYLASDWKRGKTKNKPSEQSADFFEGLTCFGSLVVSSFPPPTAPAHSSRTFGDLDFCLHPCKMGRDGELSHRWKFFFFAVLYRHARRLHRSPKRSARSETIIDRVNLALGGSLHMRFKASRMRRVIEDSGLASSRDRNSCLASSMRPAFA
jgi:hypothetical protein